jgi:putative CocE/NonD family hydrolase
MSNNVRTPPEPFSVLTIPMRDGVQLYAELFTPPGDGPFHTILVRNPYSPQVLPNNHYPVWQFYREAGYAVVYQRARGMGKSQGVFKFFFQEFEDGYDTVEWIATQPWCNGRIGMDGVSYMGTVQWQAARERPPHLVCIAPTAPGGDWFFELPYCGGAFRHSWALWWLNIAHAEQPEELVGAGLPFEANPVMQRVLKHRPLLTADELLGEPLRLYREWLEHDTLDAYWERIQMRAEDYAKIDIPVFTVTGWYDGDQPGSLYHWRGIEASLPGSRDQRHLLIGPWNHTQTFVGGELSYGEWEFSENADVDLKKLRLAFFDRYLRGEDTGEQLPDRCKLYVTGSNQWQVFQNYPPDEVEYRPLYLSSDGAANTLDGDGHLSWAQPAYEAPDRYTYDPDIPVISSDLFPQDRRPIQKRTDVLVYTTDALEEPLTVIGPVVVNLYAASDCVDTDFVAHLLDVFPDGRAVPPALTVPSVLRARYRKGMDRTVPLTPNQPEAFTIRLPNVGHTFLPGHRVRIEISSSMYPAIHPNPNTGNAIATDTESRIAHQTVYHDGEHPSHVLLPVLSA